MLSVRYQPFSLDLNTLIRSDNLSSFSIYSKFFFVLFFFHIFSLCLHWPVPAVLVHEYTCHSTMADLGRPGTTTNDSRLFTPPSSTWKTLVLNWYSLSPGKCGSNFQSVISKHMLYNKHGWEWKWRTVTELRLKMNFYNRNVKKDLSCCDWIQSGDWKLYPCSWAVLAKLLSGECHRTHLMEINIGSDNGLVPSGNKSLPEPM